MSLGVLNNIAAIYAQNNLNNTQNSLQTTLTQLSSGSRINSGADDAAGLAVADGLHANEAALTQSAQNAQNGVGLLQTADGALSQVTSLLNRAVTLSTESANGTLTSTQSSSANQEYQNILAQIAAIGSTTNFNSVNVFSNTARTVFVSDGTASGANVYSNVVGALRTNSIGQTAATGTSASIAGSTPSTSATATRSTATFAAVTTSTDALAGTITLGLVGGSLTNYTFTGSDVASGVTAFNTAFASQGISASFNAGTKVITLAGPADGSATLSVGTAALTDAGTARALSTPNAGNTGASTSTFTLPGTNYTFSGTLALSYSGFGGATVTVAPGTTGVDLAAQINNNTALASASITAKYNSTTGGLTISGPGGASGKDLVLGGSLFSVAPAAAGAAPGAGVDFSAAKISTLNNTTAQDILVASTTAIADVAYQRGIIGANINELTAASGVASSEAVNLTAAENAIRSTNYGQATSDLAKFKVLSETGISALAQANAVQQEVTKLLQ